MTNHLKLFPGYITPEESAMLSKTGLIDHSWGNDAVPFFHMAGDDEGKIQLGIDHPIDSERECSGHKRIFILSEPNDPKLLFETDDLSEALGEFGKLALTIQR